MNLQDYKDRVETLQKEFEELNCHDCPSWDSPLAATQSSRLVSLTMQGSNATKRHYARLEEVAYSWVQALSELAVVEEFGPTLNPKRVAMLAKLRRQT